jgi:hypothetical protein
MPIKKISLLIISFLGMPFFAFAQPVCPVCTLAVAGGVGLCRYLGISDMISGTWIGALIICLIMWTLKWFNKKNIRFKLRDPIITVLFYAFIIIPLYWMGIMGNPNNRYLGMDKLLFGIISGSLVFIMALFVDNALRKKNGGKAYFPFQKVVIPILFLILASLFHYFVCLK